MPTIDLSGKVAIVTGSGGGIGRAIAVAMARAGAAVVINDVGTSLAGSGLSSTPAAETKALIEAEGGRAAISTDSVAEWDSAQKIIQTALDSFGRIDIVVNNAGILRDSIFHKIDPQDWRAVIDVHLHGTFNVSRAAAEHFRKQESGSYIHMTSGAGLIGMVGQASYSAAKLGITALSKVIALDMSRYNVRSNCIAPIAWSRMTNSIPEDTPEKRALVEKLKKMTPEKNAPLAVYLASDAARHVNAQIFAIRLNEIYLMGQPRMLRSIHRSEGWTPETIAEHAMPALESSFMSLQSSAQHYSWDPV